MVRSQKTWIAYGLVSSAVVLWVGLGALHFRGEVERCAEGWVQGPTRCCLPGQSEVSGHCQGTPSSCPPPLSSALPGCIARAALVAIEGGTLILEPSDWDAPASSKRRSISIGAFQLDPFEVTHERYATCVRAQVCVSLEKEKEPSRPVTRISADGAVTFCDFVGGRLPTADEWIFAASDGGRLRYPWGPHGLTCRRAAFGLEKGPCASSGLGPELVGTRPLGARQGLFDMAGNVAEWVRLDATGFAPLGGSFRSILPAELKAWATSSHAGRPKSDPEPSEDIGFRCAYDASFRSYEPKPRSRPPDPERPERSPIASPPSRKTTR